jgi:glycosyltransferase involved in cell wall biosynthesis
MNQYYANYMAEYLAVERSRVEIIRHGLNIEHYQKAKRRDNHRAPTIGFLARVCPDKGLHLLVEAAKLLAQQEDSPGFRIRAAGYLGQLDRPYLDEIVRLAAEAPAIDFEYLGELDLTGKIQFLSSLDAMALPTVYQESKGISALEALAVGTPIIVPEHGVFPELVADTGGGILFEPNSAASLAEIIASQIAAPDQARQRGKRGQAAVHDRYTAEQMAQNTLELYTNTLERSSS